MSYIDRELTQGERVIKSGRVSWWTIVPRTLLAVALLIVAIVILVMLKAETLYWLVAIGAVLVAWVALVTSEVLRVLSTEIAITDRRIMSKSGIFRTEVKTTPLDKINNTNVKQSFIGNLLDYGDIEITTATAEERDNHLIANLAHPDAFRNTVTEVAPN